MLTADVLLWLLLMNGIVFFREYKQDKEAQEKYLDFFTGIY